MSENNKALNGIAPLVEVIKKNPFSFVLLILVIFYMLFTQILPSMDKQIIKLEERVKNTEICIGKNEDSVNLLNQNITKITVELEYIKKSLERIEKKIGN